MGVTRTWSRILPPVEEAPSSLVISIQPPGPDGRVYPTIPLYISAPVKYHLVGVVFSKPRHFVSQFLAGGTWFSYDCLEGGIVKPIEKMGAAQNTPYMVAYRRSS